MESLPDEIVNKIIMYIPKHPCGKIMKDYLYEEEHYYLPTFLLVVNPTYYKSRFQPPLTPYVAKPPFPDDVRDLMDTLTDTWWRIGSDGDKSWELVDTFYDKINYEFD